MLLNFIVLMMNGLFKFIHEYSQTIIMIGLALCYFGYMLNCLKNGIIMSAIGLLIFGILDVVSDGSMSGFDMILTTIFLVLMLMWISQFISFLIIGTMITICCYIFLIINKPELTYEEIAEISIITGIIGSFIVLALEKYGIMFITSVFGSINIVLGKFINDLLYGNSMDSNVLMATFLFFAITGFMFQIKLYNILPSKWKTKDKDKNKNDTDKTKMKTSPPVQNGVNPIGTQTPPVQNSVNPIGTQTPPVQNGVNLTKTSPVQNNNAPIN